MIRQNLLYTQSHEWVEKLADDKARVGLTDYAQGAMGDLVFVGLPQAGDEAVRGESIAEVESVKAVSSVYSPATGNITAVNEALLDAPEMINNDPYGAWLFEVDNVTDWEELLPPEAYEALLEKEA